MIADNELIMHMQVLPSEQSTLPTPSAMQFSCKATGNLSGAPIAADLNLCVTGDLANFMRRTQGCRLSLHCDDATMTVAICGNGTESQESATHYSAYSLERIEAGHRIANALQLVVSMMRAEAVALSDASAKGALQRAAFRVFTIAQAHRQMAKAGGNQLVPLREFLETIFADLKLAGEDSGIELELSSDEVSLRSERAQALAGIATELVTNSLKHAESLLRMKVECAAAAGDCRLIVSEERGVDASGDDSPPARARTDGLGRRIIDCLTKRLKAEIDFNRTGCGVVVSVRFPLVDDELAAGS